MRLYYGMDVLITLNKEGIWKTGFMRTFFGTENLKDVEEALRQSSPLMHLTKDSCPTFLQHGRADQIVPFTQSTGYYERLCQVAGAEKGKLEILDNCDHADEKMFAKENIQKVFDFADQCL